MNHTFHNLPRLYCAQNLGKDVLLNLPEDQSHYLKNVLRKTVGDGVRLFNEQSGEWVAHISKESKRSVTLTIDEQIKPPEISASEIHLIFSPIKKDRNDMVIEKAVELGVTHLHPVLFARTIVRDIKVERIEAQMMEAAEQCERLSLPKLSPLKELKKLLGEWNKDIPLFAGIERTDATPLLTATQGNPPHQSALLIGPEGGITSEEIELLNSKAFIKPVSLGPRILRAETAVFYGLSLLSAQTKA
jgi:16S rRNA (uracil1498-N3)-methyltransferase